MSDGVFLFIMIGVPAVGWFLIDIYFRRKEKFVDHLQGKMKGNLDAK